MRSIARHPIIPFFVAAASTLALTAMGETGFGLSLAPAVALLTTLLAGRLPGERLLSDLARRLRARRRPTHRSRTAPRKALVRTFGARGGLLIASGLSGRAPPPG